MKKHLFNIATFILSTSIVCSSCSYVLESENIYGKDLNNYYSNPTEVQEALNGIYNAIYVGDKNSEEAIVANLFDDLMLGGGGDDNILTREMDSFEDNFEDTYRDLWRNTFNGVYRCNAVIEKVLNTDYERFYESETDAEAFKGQVLGEAYFMRGFYFYRAARFFGGLPLIVETTTARDIPRASISETYSQIISDFKTAIEFFPNRRADSYTLEEFGHSNKWIAEGYIGRAFLYYIGYMSNILKQPTSEVVLPNGDVLTKSDIIAYIEDCRDNSGYKLLDDFRNLWAYSYVNENAAKYVENGTEPVLPWAAKEGLKWAGQDGFYSNIGTGNSEVMFSQSHAFGSWDNNTSYITNRACLHFGLRDNQLIPFYQGWGYGPVHPDFYSEWDDTDKRKEGSVLRVGDSENGTENFTYRTGEQFTGLVCKKYLSLAHNGPQGIKGMFSYIYGDFVTDYQNWSAQDFYYLRFADILLMHSELTETPDGMNKVRNRAGLGDIPYSLDALKKERMYEFAFEAIRWFDLVRWGDVENGNNYYGRTVNVINTGVEGKYKVSYRADTKGLVSLPESEIRLSNGVYEQNPGWE